MCAVWKNVLKALFRGDNGTEEIHRQDHLFTTTGCHAIDHAGWGGVTTLDNKSHTQEGKSPRWAQRVQLATPAVRCHEALGYCCGGFPVPSAPRCRAAVTAFRLRSPKPRHFFAIFFQKHSLPWASITVRPWNWGCLLQINERRGR